MDHAEEMVGVLADPTLYAVTGDEPPTLEILRDRYAWQAVGQSPDGTEAWHNWVLRLRADRAAIGFVQATVVDRAAEVAWVVGVPWQGRGYATEAGRAVVAWLVAGGAASVTAHVAEGHRASELVAERIGLRLTDEVEDGERVWRRDGARSAAG